MGGVVSYWTKWIMDEWEGWPATELNGLLMNGRVVSYWTKWIMAEWEGWPVTGLNG
jgi:hypothetical protein